MKVSLFGMFPENGRVRNTLQSYLVQEDVRRGHHESKTSDPSDECYIVSVFIVINYLRNNSLQQRTAKLAEVGVFGIVNLRCTPWVNAGTDRRATDLRLSL